MRAPYAELDWAQFREGETPRCCCAWMALCAIGKNPLASGAPYAELDWSPVGSCEFHSSKYLPFGWLNQHPSLVQAFVSPDEAEQGQSTVPRMVGEAEGVAVVNRR